MVQSTTAVAVLTLEKKVKGQDDGDVELLIMPSERTNEEEEQYVKDRQEMYAKTPWCTMHHKLYGKVSAHDRKRVSILSGTLFFIIGGYWLLRSLKDTVLAALVGLEYQPIAKVR